MPAAPERLVGSRAPVFTDSDDSEELAGEHRCLGYCAAYCPNADASERERTRAIRKAFSDSDVAISEVDYPTFLTELAQAPSESPLKIERLRAPEDSVEAFNCVKRVGVEVEFIKLTSTQKGQSP